MTYDVIYADPPWNYPHQRPGGMNNAADHYSVMDLEDIAALSQWGQLNNPGVVFMWATSTLLENALMLGKMLGLYYRGIEFVWVKTKKDGSPMGAAGVRPSIVKPLTELVLGFSNKQFGRPLPLSSESVVQTVFSPKREHSRKPDEVIERIEALYPNATKLEMFAREKRRGWDSFGNEVSKFNA